MRKSEHIKNRKSYYRECKCGRDHENKFIRGMFKYSSTNQVAFCAALLEHQEDRHIWLSFITGEWPNTGYEDCAVTCHIYKNDGDRIFIITDGSESPFELSDIFDCYQVSREQVLAVDGAKDWFIKTYLALFETDDEIGNYLESTTS